MSLDLEHIEVVDTDYGRIVCNTYDNAQTPFFKITRKAINHTEIVMLHGMLDRFFGLSNGNSLIVDIGSHIGTYPMYFTKNSKVKHVFSFEPISRLCLMQKESYTLNGITDKVTICNMALSDTASTLQIPIIDFSRPANFGGIEWGTEQIENIGITVTKGTEQMETFELDMVLNLVPEAIFDGSKVVFIKVDVEGMEEKVLRGATSTILKDRPLMFVEFLKSDQPSLLACLDQLGYTTKKMHTDFLCVPKERTDILETL